MSVSILEGETPIVSPLHIPTDGIAFKTLTITTTPARPGASYSVKTSAPALLATPSGVLDGTGKANFVFGPSRLTHDMGCTVFVDGEAPVSFVASYGG